ncbi:MAG: hypothetical protein D6755_00615 [Anaerolineae bacterium]|nr:MAG: hypothetical protein D6755_00615 [Anaerolineae bacterium]
MADVAAIFGLLLALGIAFPGMLTACYLLTPRRVEKASLRIARTPWKSFWMGVAVALGVAIPIGVLLAIPAGVSKFLGFLALFLVLALSLIGAAGIAARMAAELQKRSQGLSNAAAFVRAAVALELAVIFPFIGWMILFPLAVFTSLGATTFALLGWGPRPQGESMPPQAAPETPA